MADHSINAALDFDKLVFATPTKVMRQCRVCVMVDGQGLATRWMPYDSYGQRAAQIVARQRAAGFKAWVQTGNA